METRTESNLGNIPNFVRASSPDLLREAMLENNLRLKSEVKYQDIEELSDGSWIAWYYESIDYFYKLKPTKVKK